MITIFSYLLIGGWIGYMLGLNSKEFPTDTMNRKRVEKENQELQIKVDRYRSTIQDLVNDNKRLVKELEKHDL